jgi:hypothetical protein
VQRRQASKFTYLILKETLANFSSQVGQQEKPSRPVPRPHMVSSQPAPEEQAVEAETEEDAPASAEPGLSISNVLVNISASDAAAVVLPSTPAPRYTLRMRRGR